MLGFPHLGKQPYGRADSHWKEGKVKQLHVQCCCLIQVSLFPSVSP